MKSDPKYKLFSLFVATLSTFTVWLSILTGLDPGKSDPITKIAFFASFMLFIMGLSTMLFVYLRIISNNKEEFSIALGKSISHSTVISLFITLSLFLQSIKVLGILEICIIIFIFILVEIFMKAKSTLNE